MHTTSRLLSLLLLTNVLALGASGQTYRAAAGPKLSQAGVNSGSTPQLIYWSGSGATIVRQSWATADRGELECSARSDHYDSATFQSDAMSYASFEVDDLVFSAAGSGSVLVGLHLSIEGDYSFQLGNSLSLGAVLNGTALGSATVTGAGVSGTGYLSGYSMQGLQSFTHNISVPLNTPFALQLRMDLSAATSGTGFKNQGSYSLRLGDSTPLSPAYTVFDLPAGVTVDSPSLGIVGNVWEQPLETHLFADDLAPAPGQTVKLTAWNQPASAPVGMLYAFGPTTPPLGHSVRQWTGLVGSFDSKGWWSPAGIVSQPWMSGNQLRARAVTLGPSGELLLSAPVTIQFQ